jgi:Mu-like prophage protein gp29
MKSNNKNNNSKTPKTPSKTLASSLVLHSQSLIRKDVASWQLALQQALRVSEPRLVLLQELYSNICLDAHLMSQISLRKNRSLSIPFSIVDRAGKTLEEPTAFLTSSPVFSSVLSECLDALFFGYSLVEISPDFSSAHLLDRRHIEPSAGLLYLDLYDSSPIPYRSLSLYGSTLVEFRSPQPLGLLNQAVPHVLYKRFAQACWSELCEIYGMPPRYIKTNTQDSELLARYTEILKNIGSGASYVLDLEDEIGFAQTNSTNGAVYENLIRLCTNELSLLINGAVLGQDTLNGSNAKEATNLSMNQDIIDSDKRFISSCLNSSLIPALCSLRILPEGAIFVFQQQEDSAQLFDQTMRAAAYFDIDPQWVSERFGIALTGSKPHSSPTLAAKDERDFFA